MKKILIINGPNLNMLGVREKNIYGEESFDSIKDQIINFSNKNKVKCEIYQSNWEGALIDKIIGSRNIYDGIVINAGALAHYSYAIRDALAILKIPCVEVHMSNIYSREDFRKKSVISDVCVGQIVGFGKKVYFLAILALKDLF